LFSYLTTTNQQTKYNGSNYRYQKLGTVTGLFADEPTHRQSSCRSVNSLKCLTENLE